MTYPVRVRLKLVFGLFIISLRYIMIYIFLQKEIYSWKVIHWRTIILNLCKKLWWTFSGVLSQLSYLAVLCQLSCPGYHIPTVLSQLSCASYPKIASGPSVYTETENICSKWSENAWRSKNATYQATPRQVLSFCLVTFPQLRMVKKHQPKIVKNHLVLTTWLKGNIKYALISAQ